MRKASLLLLVLAALALAAGCGSSKKSAATTAAAATTTTASNTTAAADTTATSTTAGKINLAKADSSCKAMVAFGAQISKAMQGANAAAGGDLGKSAENAATLFAAYVKAAPSEIKPDMQAYADAFNAYAKALVGVHLKAGKVPSAADMAKITTAAHALSAASLQQHSAHLQAWATKHCGVGK
jgi:hypothetical protein